jgi:hypothetical protein
LEERIRSKVVTNFRIGFPIAFVWFQNLKCSPEKYAKRDLTCSSPGKKVKQPHSTSMDVQGGEEV